MSQVLRQRLRQGLQFFAPPSSTCDDIFTCVEVLLIKPRMREEVQIRRGKKIMQFYITGDLSSVELIVKVITPGARPEPWEMKNSINNKVHRLPYAYLSSANCGTRIKNQEIIVTFADYQFSPHVGNTCLDLAGKVECKLTVTETSALLSLITKASSNLEFICHSRT